jgi:hypothetical protein
MNKANKKNNNKIDVKILEVKNEVGEFIVYAKPYLDGIKDEYREFNRILKRHGIKNVKIFFLKIIKFIKNKSDILENTVTEIIPAPESVTTDKIKEVSQAVFANSDLVLMMNELGINEDYEHTEDEAITFQFVFPFILKLYYNYNVYKKSGHAISKPAMKEFVSQFISEYISLYNEDELTKSMASHTSRTATPSIEELKEALLKNDIKNKEQNTPILGVAPLALKYVWEGVLINKDNMNTISKTNRSKAPNAGIVLKRKYNELYDPKKRLALPENDPNKTKLKNKIIAYKSYRDQLIDLGKLNKTGIRKAKEDIELLQNKLNLEENEKKNRF